MKAATVSELKKELSQRSEKEMIDICMRLARYKKDTKELLTYLLFESGDERAFAASAAGEIREEFAAINYASVYLAKKTIRRILRLVRKYISYSGNKETALELIICFCEELKKTDLIHKENKVLVNMYLKQVEAADKIRLSLHEDLQYDYEERIRQLELH